MEEFEPFEEQESFLMNSIQSNYVLNKNKDFNKISHDVEFQPGSGTFDN